MKPQKIIIFIVSIIFLLNFENLTGQSNIFNSNYLSNIGFRYFVGTNQPDANWYMPDYIDTTWIQGHISIGYGDGDDTIVIDTTASLYIRKNLYIGKDSLEKSKALIIYADFDDGFIAYLNGVEILRVNMDENILHPDFMQTASRSHEAENYRFLESPFWKYQTVQGYYIDSTLLQKSGLMESNVLAFEVHNDSIRGSDLSFCFDYRFLYDSSTFYVTEDRSRYYNTVAIDSTQLPIVIIETDEFGCDTSRIKAFMGIIDNKSKYNRPNDVYNGYKGLINLNIRGNSTGWYAKRSYKIETIDILGNNNNVSLLGMPEENDWVLLSSYSDRSFIANTLSFTLGRKMGHYEPRSRYCELIVNGRNQGLYLLTEKIKRDPNRVKIAKLEKTDNRDVEVSGGYIFTHIGVAPLWITLEYPNNADITEAQYTYITNFYADAIKVLKNKNFLDSVDGYKKYFDLHSLIDFMIIEELSRNHDAYSASFYSYKDRDNINGRIKFGPLWDYDNAFGIGIWNDTLTEGWGFDNNNIYLIERILQDSTAAKLFATKWHTYRKSILNLDSIYAIIDSSLLEIRSSVDVNFKIWQTLEYKLKPFDYAPTPGYTYDDEIINLKGWIVRRIQWIDNNIDNIYLKLTNFEKIDNITFKNTIFVYPNPVKNEINLTTTINKPGTYEIVVSDISGRKVIAKMEKINYTGTNKITILVPQKIPKGFYSIGLHYQNKLLAKGKFVKH